MTNDSIPNSNEEQKPTDNEKQSTIITQAQVTDVQDERIRRCIRIIVDEAQGVIEQWLSMLDKFYDGWKYSSTQRIEYTIPILNEEQQLWYEQHKEEIQDNWKFFCEQLKLNAVNLKPTQTVTQSIESTASNGPEAITLEEMIDSKFEKYSGVGDPKRWLLYTTNQFKTCGLRREDQFEAIPLLLEGDAYIWYVENSEAISNFELFSKLLLQQFKLTEPKQTSSTRDTIAPAVTVSDNLSTSHLHRTVADDIIKRPTYFRGSQDDVYDWLDKLEQRFSMAQWNEENKLNYIPIHLQEDAYRWWMQTSSTIKTWSSFKDTVIRAFGSTRKQELAFEQLKWCKQSIHQSITQYYDKVMELCRKVDPAMPDSLKLKYLMGGIKNSLKTHVALQDPKTTEAFLSSARKIEDIIACTNPKTELIPEVITLNATAYQGQSNQANFARNNFRDFNSRQTRANNYQEARFQDQQQQRPKYSKFTKRSQLSNVCYNCGTPGHYARNCTRPHFH